MHRITGIAGHTSSVTVVSGIRQVGVKAAIAMHVHYLKAPAHSQAREALFDDMVEQEVFHTIAFHINTPTPHGIGRA